MFKPTRITRTCAFLLIFTSFSVGTWDGLAQDSSEIGRLQDLLFKRTLRFTRDQKLEPHNAISILVEPGDDTQAKAYYARISGKLGFMIRDPRDVPERDSTLTSLLQYLGYDGLQADDLELLDSKLLMPTNETEFDRLASQVADPTAFRVKLQLADFLGERVLVSRFFAPKIVNFNQPVAGADPNRDNLYVAGWRKLVRVAVRAGSQADSAGLNFAYVLFNYFEKDPATSPFPTKEAPQRGSKNNQVILTPRTFKAGEEDAVYWIVYQARSIGYRVGLALRAGFDLPDDQHSNGLKDYFVPVACAECHGHDSEAGDAVGAQNAYPFGKVNYLDTDQWHDQAGFGFKGTQNGPFGVLFDAGKDIAATQYQDGFRVLLKMNEEILRQNNSSKRKNGDDLFKIKAVEKWLQLHTANAAPVRFAERPLEVSSNRIWDKDNANEQKLLAILDQYCFRCHSSMFYNIFDRSAVARRKRTIEIFVSGGFMPQGRKLDDVTRAQLADFVRALQN